MAIKINTAYGERLTSGMLNDKISGVVGGNEKVSGFNVAVSTPKSVTITPGRAYVNGCSIEETSVINTVSLDEQMLSKDSLAYIVLDYAHETKNVAFSCVSTISTNMVKLATLVIKNGAITELVNHEAINTLNTVVGASADVEAQKIRDMIPSGFIELGQLDYTFMLNNENKVKMQGKSVAYVNGYRVEIPAGTIIDIGKAPEKESREDLLFLEAWKDSDFLKSGTLKWRIRHVADVNFNNTSFVEGLAYQGGTLDSALYTKLAFPQGGNIDPLSYSDYSNDNERFTGIFRVASLSTYDWQKTPYVDDKGLFLSKLSKNKTVDGYVYAIPMFKLHRKPSCGKSIPFEYSNINPKADYSKIAKLMKEEKVEKVIAENIQGKSALNLVKGTGIHDNFHINATLSSKGFDSANNRLYATVGAVTSVPNYAMIGIAMSDISSIIDASKKYTIVFDSIGTLHPYGVAYTKRDSTQTVFSVVSNKSGQYGRHVVTCSVDANFVPNVDGRHLYFWFTQSQVAPGKTINIENVMILEGDWSNKKIPTFFTGLKSLGEDDGNVVIAKNGILSNDSYDVNDIHHKLPALPTITHVNSTNLLTPTMEANILRGEESTPSGALPAKITTDGTEILRFTKIKGRTLQNLFGADKPHIQNASSRLQCSNLKNGYMYTAGTYTIVNLSDKLIIPNEYQDTKWIQRLNCQPRSKTLVTLAAGRSIREVVAMYSDGWTENDLQYFLNSLVILKGDHTATPLERIPFIKGIKSTGEAENNVINLRNMGKNLFDGKLQRGYWFNGALKPSDYSVASINNIPVKHNTSYTITIKNYKGRIYVAELNSMSQELVTHNITSGTSVTISKGSFIKFCTENSSNVKVDLDVSIQIEEGISSTAYAPHKEYNQDIYLKEPLRSLSNTIFDEIVDNKVIRRVKKDVFNGSENWVISDDDQIQTIRFSVQPRMPFKLVPAISDKFVYYSNTANDVECFTAASDTKVHIRILRKNINPVNVAGFKTWLSQNPVAVYYALDNPVEECLENVYEKESIKTYQLDAPLRSLPGGAKDEIKDGVLIRRCGEFTLTGADNENMRLETSQTFANSLYFNVFNAYSRKTNSAFLCDKFKPYNRIWHDDVEGINGDGSTVSFRINKNKLTSHDVAGFKKWLQANAVKVIYELATPVNIQLAEVRPQVAKFSLDRQFQKGNWLRELPNGIKDTIENGKVVRRTIKLTFDGDEAWTLHSNNVVDKGTLYRYFLPIDNLLTIGEKQDILLCDKLKVHNDIASEVWSCENMHYRIDPAKAGIYIVKDGITTPESFKTWLSKNPISIIAPLAVIQEETLSADNYTYYPCHAINTCCGNMYVGEGRNYIENDNRMSNDNHITVETDFRKIENKAKVEDCRYKKCDDGYDTSYAGSKSKNLISKSMYSNSWFMDDRPHLNHWDSTGKHYSIYNIVVNPDKSYYLSSDQVLNRVNGKWLDENENFISFFRLSNGSGAGYTSSALPKSPAGARYLCLYVDSLGNLTSKNYNIQLEEGTTNTEYTDYIPTTKYFENTAENDIEDLRHQVSLTGFNYDKILNESFDKLLRGELK